MKSLNIVFISLFVCAYLTNVQCSSTILDLLKIGFDTVYKYEEQFITSYLKIKDFETIKYDVLLRRSSDNSDKIIMHLNDVRYEGNDRPTQEEFEAFRLPILFSINSEFDLDTVYASPADTNKSLSSKHDALSLLLHNMTETIRVAADTLGPINSITFDMTLDDLPLGNCKTEFKCFKTDTTYDIEVSTKRKSCSGDIDHSFLDEFGLTDMSPDSELKLFFSFDKINLKFIKSGMSIFGKASEESKKSFKANIKLYFDKWQTITEEIDETLYTKEYTDDQLMKLS